MKEGTFLSRRMGDLKARRQSFRELDAKSKRVWWMDFFVKYAIYIIIAGLVIYTQIFCMTSDKMTTSFLDFYSIIDILKRASAAMFMALGVGGIIVLTGTDLSAGRAMGIIACVAASLLQKPVEVYAAKMFPNLTAPPIILVLLLCLLIGGAIGMLNGFCVAQFKLHPFIVTLATMLIINGAALVYIGINGGGPISELIEPYKEVVKGNVLIKGTAIPYYVFYAVIAAVVMWFMWNKTTLGKNMYAVGANPDAATVSGVSVMKTTILIFTIAGILYGFSGFVEAARIGSNNANTGVGKELDAIAACVIGGVSFTGGVGKISGIITGVILLNIIEISMQWLGVASEWTLIIKGFIILVAVALDMRKYLVRK